MVRALSHRRVIIVGAGHSGLAVAAALITRGLEPQKDFVVIDAALQGQRSWATRWHSMMLLSDARRSALPAFPFPGDQSHHPRADEMLDYLESVETSLGVRTVWGISALTVRRLGDGSTLQLSTSAGDVQTRNIVCATGAAAVPRIPEWSRALAVPGVVLHSSKYLYPAQIPAGDVLIVGGGFSGVQLVEELRGSHDVTLSTRTGRRHGRQKRSFSVAADAKMSWSQMRRSEPVLDRNRARVPLPGVKHVPAVVESAGATLTFADGSQMQPQSVILATGYTPGDSWLPGLESSGPSPHVGTSLPGLFVVGIPDYTRVGADTIAGAWRDAVAASRHITERP